MKQSDPQLKIRLPPEIKEWLEKVAKESNRSMNAEIVACLSVFYREHQRLTNADNSGSAQGNGYRMSADEALLLSKYTGIMNLLADMVADQVESRLNSSGKAPSGRARKSEK